MNVFVIFLHNEQMPKSVLQQTSIECKKAINDNLIRQFCSNYAVQCSVYSQCPVSSAWAFDIYRSLTDIIILHLLKCIQLMQLVMEFFLNVFWLPFEKKWIQKYHLISNEPVDCWSLIWTMLLSKNDANGSTCIEADRSLFYVNGEWTWTYPGPNDKFYNNWYIQVVHCALTARMHLLIEWFAGHFYNDYFN